MQTVSGLWSVNTVKGRPSKEEPEVSHSKVHGQELAVEGAVLGLRFAQLLAEEPQRLSGAFDLLLEDR